MLELTLAALAILPLAAVELAKAYRWRALIGAERPSYLVCLRALIVGQLTNAFSPVRAGEAVRVGVLRAQGGPTVAAVGALAGVKALDALCLAAVAATVLGRAALGHARLSLAAGALILVGGLLLARLGGPIRAMLDRHPVGQKLRLSALVEVAQTVREPQILVAVAVTTVLVWAAGLAANAVILAAAGIPPTYDLAARVLVAGYLVGAVPAPPARLGVFETAVTVALTSAGVPLAAAVTAAVSLHVCQFAELGILMAVSLVARRQWVWSA